MNYTYQQLICLSKQKKAKSTQDTKKKQAIENINIQTQRTQYQQKTSENTQINQNQSCKHNENEETSEEQEDFLQQIKQQLAEFRKTNIPKGPMVQKSFKQFVNCLPIRKQHKDISDQDFLDQLNCYSKNSILNQFQHYLKAFMKQQVIYKVKYGFQPEYKPIQLYYLDRKTDIIINSANEEINSFDVDKNLEKDISFLKQTYQNEFYLENEKIIQHYQQWSDSLKIQKPPIRPIPSYLQDRERILLEIIYKIPNINQNKLKQISNQIWEELSEEKKEYYFIDFKEKQINFFKEVKIYVEENQFRQNYIPPSLEALPPKAPKNYQQQLADLKKQQSQNSQIKNSQNSQQTIEINQKKELKEKIEADWKLFNLYLDEWNEKYSPFEEQVKEKKTLKVFYKNAKKFSDN